MAFQEVVSNAGVQQHAEAELALMHAIPAMAYDAASLPYVCRVLDQLCPSGKAIHRLSFLCVVPHSLSFAAC